MHALWSCFFAIAALPSLLSAAPAGPPEGLTASATALSGEVQLSWQAVTAPAAVSGYHVYHNSVSDLAGATTFYVAATGTVVTGLADRARRWFFVASDDAGFGPGLTGSAVSAVPFQPPDAVALSATVGSYSDQAQVTWSAPVTYGSPLGSLRLESESSGTVSLLGSYGPGTLNAQFNLGCGGGVTLRARVYDAHGSSSAASAPLYLRSPCPPLLLSGPVTDSGWALNWTPSLGGDGLSAWEVRSATGPGFSDPLPDLVTVTAATTISAVLPLPPQGQGLWARVYGANALGLSSVASNESAFLAPPVDLAATPYQGRVHLRWSAIASHSTQGVTAYQVYYATYAPTGFGDPFMSVSVTARAVGSAQAVTISGLSDHSQYWFSVAAQGGSPSARVGPASLTVSAVPGLPSPVFTHVEAPGTGQLEFSWTAVDASPSTPVAYHLQRSFSADLSSPEHVTLSSATAITGVAASAPGTVAWYYVQVSDTAGNLSSLSPPAASVLRLPSLEAPVLALAETANARVRLRWEPVPEAASYRVYRATFGVSVSAAVFVPLIGGEASGTELIDTQPVNGLPNAYVVRALLPIGIAASVQSSPASNAVTAVPRALPGIPGRYGAGPSGSDLAYLTVVARPLGGVDLAWTAAAAGSSALSGYRVWRGYSPLALSVVADVASPTLTAYSDLAAPLPLASLVYGVQALDHAGAYGPRVSGTVGAATAWPMPLSFSATVLSGGVRLSWASPSGRGTYALSSYALSRRWQAGGPYDALAQVTSLAYVDLSPDAAQGSQPSYQLRVLDSGGVLGSSASLSVTLAPASLPLGVPSTVSGISAVTVAAPGIPVDLAWRPNPQAEAVSAYRVYRGLSLLTETAGLSWSDSPGVGGSYEYHVQALNAQGLGVSGTAVPAPIFVAPPQPVWVSVTASVDPGREGGDLGLRLSWQDLGAPGALDDYQLYAQAGAFTGLGSAMLLTETVATAFEDQLLSPSAQVAYVVLGRSGGHASASPVAQLSLQVPAAPQPVTGLSASARSDGAWLGWDDDAAAVEYWVFRSTAALPAHPLVAQRLARVSTAFYIDTTASGAEPQRYAVAAVNGLGRGSATGITITPLGGLPSSLSATAGYDGTPIVQLQWAAPLAPQSATGYRVWRDTDPAELAAGGGTELSVTAGLAYSDAVPLTNTAYHYGVSGFNLTEGPIRVTGPVRAYLPPSMPGMVLASGGPGAVEMSWTMASAHEGVTGWALSLDVGGVPDELMLPLAPSAHRVDGLAAGTMVSFSVRALNSAGGSAFSVTVGSWANAEGAAPQPLSFTALSGYSGTLTSQAKVFLSWSGTGAGSFLLYRSAAPMPLSLASGGPASPVYLTGLSGIFRSLTDTLEALGQPLDYAITAVNANGLPGGESAPRLAGTVIVSRSPSLVSLSATAGAGRVDLAWGAPQDPGSFGLAASPYRLHRRTGGAVPVFASLVNDPGFPLDLSTSAYVDLNVVNGQSYWYFLSLVDGAGNDSREAAVPRDAVGAHRTMQPQGPPRPPEPILAVAGDRSVSLRWLALQSTALSGARYNVYRRLASGDYAGAVPGLYQVGPSATDFVNVTQVVLTLRDDALLPSPPTNKVPYFYSVSAINAWGEGPKSAEIAITPYRPLDPGMVNIANRLLDLSIAGKKDIALAWGATPDQDPAEGYALASYRVYRSQNGGNTYALIADLTATAMVDDSTTYGAAYTYRVVPVDSAGNEGYSYTLQTVVIPSAVNSVLVFRNAFNPAVGETLPLQFALQEPGNVWVKIFTLNGEYVATVFDELVPVASQEQPYLSDRKAWDGRNADGQMVASGVYLIHMEGPGFRQNARVAVIK